MDVSIDRNPESPLTLTVPQADTKISKPGDDINLFIQKQEQRKVPTRPAAGPSKLFPMQQKQTLLRPMPAKPMPPKPAPPKQSPAAQPEFINTLEDFANPTKLRQTDEEPDLPDEYSDTESEILSQGSGGQPSEYSVDEPEEPDELPDYLRPSPGFSTIDEEKASLIFKLARAKRAGMPSSRTFTMASDIRDMRSEMARIDHELALDGSIKFQRKMLMMTVSVLEHLNTRYDPFELQLSGWSESVHSSVSDYDRVFERLHEKYKSKVAIAPEIELLFMVAGSAMMFHFTKTVFKQGLPGMTANPELMQSMMKAFAQAQTTPKQPVPLSRASEAPQPAQPSHEKPSDGSRREMRGPQMDLGNILGGLTGGGAMPFPPMAPPIMSKSVQKPEPVQKAVTFAPGTKRPAEDDEERLSDVVSDLESVPDDLSSLASESTEDGAVRTVSVKGGKGRGKRSKTVITL